MDASKFSGRPPTQITIPHLSPALKSVLRNGMTTWVRIGSVSGVARTLLTGLLEDHCADMLRQKLMCDADVGIITYNWLKNHYAPHPNFNVQHQCRDFDAVLQYALDHQIDGSSLQENYFVRPTDRPTVEFDEPPADPMAEGWTRYGRGGNHLHI